MKVNKWFYLARIAFLFLPHFTMGQNTFIITPYWSGYTYLNGQENKKIPYLRYAANAHEFPDAMEQWAPYLTHQIKLPNQQEIAQIQIIEKEYQVLSNSNDYTALKPNDVFLHQSEVVQVQQYGFIRKEKVATLRIYPLKYENGQYHKLTRLVAQYTLKNNSNPALRTTGARSYANNSVLASGYWAKIGVTRSGIYKLTYNDLQNLGFPVSSINPKQIRIFGNGGSILPTLANTTPPDDLKENPIVVVGENDNVFNPEDYILFYGQSPHDLLPMATQIVHRFNIYSDTTFYFITADIPGNGLRVTNNTPIAAPATHTYTTYNAYTFFEKDLYSLIKSGKTMFGESFTGQNTSYNYTISMTNVAPSTNIVAYAEIAYRGGGGTFSLSAGSNVSSINLTPYNPSYVADYAIITNRTLTINSNTISSPTLTFTVNYAKNGAGEAWLNFLRINYTKTANLNENYLQMVQLSNISTGNIHEYFVQNANGASFWDVTDIFDIRAIPYTLSGTTAQFKVDASKHRWIVAFNQNATERPLLLGRVANQNLHGMNPAEFYIITHESLLPAAEKLAQFHREQDNMSVAVVSIRQIYNEFASGKADVVAIRDFLKMHYDRGIVLPKNALLMGYAGYSPKVNGCLIPTYQTSNSVSPVNSIGFDQFIAGLDDVDGKLESSVVDELDIGVGRFPARNLSEANAMVDKIIRYKTSKEGLGRWRNTVTLLADDMYYEGLVSPPEIAHFNQMEAVAEIIEKDHPQYNVNKLYTDAYPVISTAVGKRRPDVKQKVIESFTQGTLILSFAGHGNGEGIGHERLFNMPDLNTFSNPVKMPLMVTATCEFGRYDDPEKSSIGIEVFKKADGGAVALLTTTRLVYASANEILNKNFTKSVFDTMSNGSHFTLGEIYMKSMNLSGLNSTAFALLGDPAMKLNYPEKRAVITKVTGLHTTATLDTLKALTKIRVEGEVRNSDGSINTGYNGILYPTVFDKPASQNTIVEPKTFKSFKNIIFQGKSSITAGKFAFEFVVPKDIDYLLGKGKISLYFENGQVNQDGGGYNVDILVGGVNPNPPQDNQGPKIDLFMNDENFVRGGIVDDTPILIAKIYDENGINTVGTSIGHDITGRLNDDAKNDRVLNPYFTYDLNSYQSGKVNYQLEKLNEGRYTMRVKAWDVFNNSNESVTEFVVAKSAELALANVLNYPNPFSTYTEFWFEHNRPGEILEVTIQIYTISGRLIKTIQQDILSEGTQVRSIQWDGLDDFGDRISRGTYIYKLQLRSSKDKKTVSQYQKLVIIR
ncbi:MAG: type IX secretion system sortase PorU [Bacteroidia bacterium]|nr:type IX secretion system sortase PorU [Bacteroidia bacterium]MDW8346034.1 type IX secretion system sortase PorU [Bacteroidia bacterium]